MSANIPTHFKTSYATNVSLLLQQMDSRLRRTFTPGKGEGEQATTVDQYGKVEAQEVTGRLEPTTRQDIPTARRWCFPIKFDVAQVCDTFDKMQLAATDPQSSMAKAAAAAMARKIDAICAGAYFETAYTGKTPAASATFLAANQISVSFKAGAAVGLTVRKLLEALRILRSYNFDTTSERLYCPLGSKQMDDLLQEVGLTNRDYTNFPALMQGKVSEFANIEFIHYEYLPVNGSSYRRIPVYPASAFNLLTWIEPSASIDKLVEVRGQPYQLYNWAMMGASRNEEEKVIEIPCSEA